jgi:hypothetical protein
MLLTDLPRCGQGMTIGPHWRRIFACSIAGRFWSAKMAAGSSRTTRATDIGDRDRAACTLDPIRQQALAWVDHLVSGEATDQNAAAVNRWRAQDPVHERAFAEAVHLPRRLGSL